MMMIARRLQWIFGLLFFGVMFVNLGISTYSAIVDLRGPYDGWLAERQADARYLISGVDESGPAAALRPGDRIVSIDGVRPEANRRIVNLASRLKPGASYSMMVERDGRTMEFQLAVARRPFFKPALMWIGMLAQRVVYPLVFLLPALIVFLLKPGDKQAFLLMLFLGTFMAFIMVSLPRLPVWLTFLAYLASLLGTLFWPVLFHFFLVFPETPPLLRRRPWLEWCIYIPYLLTIFPFHLVNRYWFRFDPSLAWKPAAFGKLDVLFPYLSVGSFWVIVLYLAGGLAALAINYWRVDRLARRKMNVAVLGSLLGFIVLILLVVAESVFQRVWFWFQLVGLIALPMIPASFTYAIVRHQVIPVGQILRRGVRYFLVSRGSVVLEAVAVGLLIALLFRTVFKHWQLPGQWAGVIAATTGFIAWHYIGKLHARFLGPMIDRRFFRRSYDSHQIIADLADSLRRTSDVSHLTEQVAKRIQSALQAESVAVLLRDEATGDYLSRYSCEYSVGDGNVVACQQQFRLPHFAESIGKLAESGQPIEIELNSSHSIEAEALRRMKPSLMLPLAGKDELAGVISLGARLGDLPYSREDKRLLMSVAGPTAFAIENARLVERMIEEARRREEIEAENEARAKELEEARQLQLSMLPRQVPELPGLEIAAYMKTATEVGGDYYDFHLGGDGTLTIVIGDATGHGLKAGTVVTATKSLLNHLAGADDIPAILQQASLALKRMNLRGLFMAMTMLKLRGDRLSLSVAGMPPVLVYRADRHCVEELGLRGVPLGSVAGYSYREQTITLSAGDIVLLMSDGLPERFDAEDEMLGYDSAKALLTASATAHPRQIIEQLVQLGDEWGNGRPQDDDVTFVVMKKR
jgi:serine phosphatase RsbU (regulator of sigma subunit)